MKATEIQIGDLLQCDEIPCRGHRVDYISEFDCEIGTNGEIYGLEHLFPILLTPEILEKNGWLFIEGQDYSTFPVPSKWTYQSVPFALRVDGEHYTIANTFTIKYVHELQHALRLCGLNDSADNFKV